MTPTHKMRNLIARSLRYHDDCLWILDQTKLPQQEIWLPAASVADLVQQIKQLQIRGAPAIGIAASILIGHLAATGATVASLQAAIDTLREARPTAVNLMNNLAVMQQAIKSPDWVSATVAAAEGLFAEDIKLCELIAQHGVKLIEAGSKILTYCNTGGLATAGNGTALGIIGKAQQQHKAPKVWVCETRPLLQGGRLTAWELQQQQIAATLICDNMAASLMANAQVDMVLVGADRIAANGDFANKIGTYNLAVLAKYHNIPFYVAAPYTTIDSECPNGRAIPIEQRAADEVRGVVYANVKHIWAPAAIPVWNPAFDVTPAELVTAWITDKGINYRMQAND